jgi:hypothetical protein
MDSMIMAMDITAGITAVITAATPSIIDQGMPGQLSQRNSCRGGLIPELQREVSEQTLEL